MAEGDDASGRGEIRGKGFSIAWFVRWLVQRWTGWGWLRGAGRGRGAVADFILGEFWGFPFIFYCASWVILIVFLYFNSLIGPFKIILNVNFLIGRFRIVSFAFMNLQDFFPLLFA